jgi:hypothetical protein
MKRMTRIALSAVLALGVASVLMAGDEAKTVMVSGKLVCAKCTLKKAEAKECQNVLVTEGAKGAMTEYYLVKNEVLEAFGHQCQGEKAAVVSGTVAEKDGKMWLTASLIEPPK